MLADVVPSVFPLLAIAVQAETAAQMVFDGTPGRKITAETIEAQSLFLLKVPDGNVLSRPAKQSPDESPCATTLQVWSLGEVMMPQVFILLKIFLSRLPFLFKESLDMPAMIIICQLVFEIHQHLP